MSGLAVTRSPNADNYTKKLAREVRPSAPTFNPVISLSNEAGLKIARRLADQFVYQLTRRDFEADNRIDEIQLVVRTPLGSYRILTINQTSLTPVLTHAQELKRRHSRQANMPPFSLRRSNSCSRRIPDPTARPQYFGLVHRQVPVQALRRCGDQKALALARTGTDERCNRHVRSLETDILQCVRHGVLPSGKL